MGLIKAIAGAIGGTFADQWKEFFYCESIDNNTLVVKGQKRVGSRSSNTKGTDNIISNGSVIAVADGQCMIIVDQGKVVEFCAEPGEFVYDTSTEPSLFAGSLGSSILGTFKSIGRRFTFGGEPGKDQRVYYFNTKEILDNKFGTPNPVMFRVVDTRMALDIDVSLRCSGMFSYKIYDPILFYTNISGNVEQDYQKSQIESQMKAEFIAALQPALAKLSDMELRPNQIMAHTTELSVALNEQLSMEWGNKRGIKVENVSFSSVTLPEEDQALIKKYQERYMLKDASMAGATLVGAQANAMEAAANNPNGAMNGFVGMGMAMNMGGNNISNLYAMGQQQQMQQQMQQPQMQQPMMGQPQAAGWTCSCGTVNTGNFCQNCGKPMQPASWTCSCGTVNTGNFCQNCGKPRA